MASRVGPAMSTKPHAVCLPAPGQGHINAIIKLARLLHCRGFHITFVNTEFIYSRMVSAWGGPGFLDSLPSDFQFMTIPDGLPRPSDAESTPGDSSAACYSIKNLMRGPFCNLVEGLNRKAALDPSFPAVSCILSDSFMTFSSSPVGQKLGIPVVNLWTVPACVIMCLMQYPKLMEKGFNSSKDDSDPNYLQMTIDWIPGIKSIRLHDITNFIRARDTDDIVAEFAIDAMNFASESAPSATVIHTFESLEKDVFDALLPMFPGPVFAIGPSSLLLDQIPEEVNHMKHVSCNLWEEDSECLQWLDSQERGSVLYINFGSIASLTQEQLVEFAMGISNSKHPFLWIIRPDLVRGEAALLPEEFTEKTEGTGITTKWCPQERVLNHRAIGGFLTHCGWNSTIESLSAGVPMMCWPYFGDQWTNCRFICTEWGCGLEIDRDVKRDEVEKLVKELMEGEKGKDMKKRAMEWKRLAEEATAPYGSSSLSFDRLIHHIHSNGIPKQ